MQAFEPPAQLETAQFPARTVSRKTAELECVGRKMAIKTRTNVATSKNAARAHFAQSERNGND